MVQIRKITEADLDQVVEIHKSSFDGFFLTSLGGPFLKTYYKSILRSKDGISLCAEDNMSRIIGFCIGASKSKGFHKRLILNNIVEYSIHLFRLVLSRPRAVIRLILNLEKKTDLKLDGLSSELLSIGVLKSEKGKGIGKMLLLRFEEESLLSGASAIILTTDYFENEKVVKFYSDAGYTIICDFITYPGRRMNKMIKQLSVK